MKSLNKYLIQVQIMDHKIAIVGATGNVGREMLNILYDKKFKSKNIFPVASSRSAGSKVDFDDWFYKIETNIEEPIM